MKQSFIILSCSIIILSFAGCKKTTPPDETTTTPDCLEHLKGNSFETYKVDTQSFDGQTNAPISSKGSLTIDSLSNWYIIQTFNANADSVTKTAEGWTHPTRSFKIIGHSMFYGDDEMPFENCSLNGFQGIVLEEGATPHSYLKMNVYFRAKK
jgi:hypothetical protein